MPRYCTHCAGEVEVDAKYCPSCRAPVGVAAALAGELREGTARTFQDLKNDPAMAVPVTIWAAVWEVFTTMLLAVCWLALTLSFVVARVGFGGGSGVFGVALGATVESALVWSQFAILVLGLGAGSGVTLTYGLLAEKGWGYGLYLWTKPILVVAGVLLMLTFPAPEGGGLLAVRMVQYLLVGLAAALQVYLIIAIRKQARARR